MDKYEFSQEDYLMYEFYFVNQKENKIVGIASKRKGSKHDKTFKGVLKDKKEMSEFLRQFIGLEVNISELQIYNSEFINSRYEKRISDIIYKEKDKEIYYLIEHQSKVDINMPNRILEYCMELMKEVKKNQNNIVNPLIVPIVIYTGTNKWTVSENFSDTQKVEERYKKYAINLKYKLIDINKYSKEELTNKNTKMTNLMLLEKCKKKSELRDAIMRLWNIANIERKKWIEDLIKYLFPEILSDKEVSKLIKGEEKLPMQDLIERMRTSEKILLMKERDAGKREGKREGIKEGIKETIKMIIKNMLKANQDDDTIMRFTHVKKKDIDEIRKELGIN